MKRRILATLLSLCLVVGLFPATALAAEEGTFPVKVSNFAELKTALTEDADADTGDTQSNNEENVVAMVGDMTYTTLAEAVAHAKASDTVTMMANTTETAATGGYRKAGIVHDSGCTIDGNGYTLTVEGANNTWDCAIYTKGGTIKNLTIAGAFRGIFTDGLTQDLYVDNCVIDNVCYTFSADGSGDYDVVFTNTTLNGWTSYTSGFQSVSFTDCTFGKGTGRYQYAYLRPYSDTTITNCAFSEGFKLDATQEGDVVLKNCTVGGVVLTQANLTELLGDAAASAELEHGVTYTYSPAGVPAKLPINPYFYEAGQQVRIAAKPEDTKVGGGTWKFLSWTLNGVEVAPNSTVPMVEGGLKIVGNWAYVEDEADKYGVTYTYSPAGVPAALPTNTNTYEVGQMVKIAAKPEDREVGGGTWKFLSWTLNGVEVAPNSTIPMVEGGLKIVGNWEYAEDEADKYGVTYKYVDDKGAENVPANVPVDSFTYSVGQQVPVASAPDDVTVSGGVWKFQGWTVNGVNVSGNVPMTEGGLEITGVWKYISNGSSASGGGSSHSSTYSITIESAKHGDVISSHKRASKGTTITITVKPDKGYALDELTVIDKNGDEIKLTKKSDKYTFKMPASKVTVEAAFAETDANPFEDVKENTYYYDAVKWAAEKGITCGTAADTFDPNATCTRAQVVTFLWRAAGSPDSEGTEMPFTDVAYDAYYYDAVLWAVENGITSGTSATTFSPDATVTRAQNVTFLWRWAEASAVETVNPFTDVAADMYYHDAVLWAADEGITAGTSATTFSPDDPCLRSQIVTFLYRFLAQ